VWNYAAKLRRTWKYATVRVSAQPHSVYVKAIQQVQLDEKAASNGWSGSHIVSISLVRCANLYEFVQADVFHFLQEVCLKFGYYVVSQWAQLVKDLPPTLKRVTLERVPYNEPFAISLAKFSDSLERVTLVAFQLIDTPVLPKLTYLSLERTTWIDSPMIAPNLVSLHLLKYMAISNDCEFKTLLPESTISNFSFLFDPHTFNAGLAMDLILPTIAPTVTCLYFLGVLHFDFPCLETAAIDVDHGTTKRFHAPLLRHLKLVRGRGSARFLYYYEDIAEQLHTLTIFIPPNEFVQQFIRKCRNLKILRTNTTCHSAISSCVVSGVRILPDYP